MLAKVHSLGVDALDGLKVTAEVDISGGLPQFTIVGLPDNAVKETTDRVRSALKNLGYNFPLSRITVNLAPANTKKTGPMYDLPVLLGILACTKQINLPPKDCAFIGELSLDGGVRPVRGLLPMAMACRQNGIQHLFVPAENVSEAAVVEGLLVYPVTKANDVIHHLSRQNPLLPALPTALNLDAACQTLPDFSDVHGQPEARRALEIAAVGMHNFLLIGTPGAGKTMLAKRLPGILPPITRAQALQTSIIHSVSGMLRKIGEEQPLVTVRPFRSPHHSISAAGLAGGGTPPKPGEISLAHNGVLFLDELPEFKRDALEILRQPMEDGQVSVSRVAGNITYPCRFILAAAMNPCPCGYFGHPKRECRCLDSAIDRYIQKISGPLLDRIDLHIEVQPVDYESISASSGGESSHSILKRVLRAQDFAQQRSQNQPAVANATLQGDRLRQDCPLTDSAAALMKQAFDKMHFTARGYDKVLRVSRTIADLDASEVIGVMHVSEAVQYRNLDRKYWHTR